jgi:hypothetical protein
MPADEKGLFRPDALRPNLTGFDAPPAAVAARARLVRWAEQLSAGALDRKKETELLPGFIPDVFEGVLGYTRPATSPYTLKREALVQVDGNFADAALGRFGETDQFVAAVEGKGPRDPLERPFAGRTYPAVDQALKYAVQLQIDWYLVTNIREIRLYHKWHDTHTFERFETAKLAADDAEFGLFAFLLRAERILRPVDNLKPIYRQRAVVNHAPAAGVHFD